MHLSGPGLLILDANGSAPAPLPSSNPPTTTAASLIDLLDGPMAPVTTASAAPAQATIADPFAASGPDYELLGGQPEPVRIEGDIEQWYRMLCVRDRGVLYEDTYLQVGC